MRLSAAVALSMLAVSCGGDRTQPPPGDAALAGSLEPAPSTVPTPNLSRCLAPVGENGAAVPPLAVVPAEVWSRTLGGGDQRVVLAVHGDALALTTGPSLFILDRFDGATRKQLVAPRLQDGEVFTDLVMDSDGDIYVGGRALYSYALDGTERWRALENDGVETDTPLVSPEGRVLVTTSQGRVAAFDELGQLTWSTELPAGTAGTIPYFGIGVGDAVTVKVRGGPAPVFVDEATGRMFGVALDGDDKPVLPFMGYVDGSFLATSFEGFPAKVATHMIDRCGSERWVLPAAQDLLPQIVAMDGAILMLDRAAKRPVRVGPGGSIQATGVSGSPILEGRDGTVYLIECGGAGEDSRLVAVDATFAEKWSLPLGPDCPYAATMAEDGMLYLRAGVAGVRAIATPSPGPSSSIWPMWYRDQHANRWVD